MAVLPSNPPTLLAIFGNRDFRAERLVAYEAGWRVQPARRISLDLSAFFNRYDDLRSGEVGTPFLEVGSGPHVVVPIVLQNGLHGESSGVECALLVQAAPGWRLQAHLAALRMNVSEDDVNRREPRLQAWLRSAVDLPRGLQSDIIARHVGALREFDVDAYTEADLRLAWKSEQGRVEVALVGDEPPEPQPRRVRDGNCPLAHRARGASERRVAVLNQRPAPVAAGSVAPWALADVAPARTVARPPGGGAGREPPRAGARSFSQPAGGTPGVRPQGRVPLQLREVPRVAGQRLRHPRGSHRHRRPAGPIPSGRGSRPRWAPRQRASDGSERVKGPETLGLSRSSSDAPRLDRAGRPVDPDLPGEFWWFWSAADEALGVRLVRRRGGCDGGARGPPARARGTRPLA